MCDVLWEVQIEDVWRRPAQTNTSIIMSNEFITISAGLTDMIEAREENLREECGSQYTFSTAFPLARVISLSTVNLLFYACRRDYAKNIDHTSS